MKRPITRAGVFFCFFFLSCEGELRPKAAADRSHMLPRCSALQRCQASLKEWSASLLCYPTIMCLTFPWQRCHSTSPPSFQLEGPCPPPPLIKHFAANHWFKATEVDQREGWHHLQYHEKKINNNCAKKVLRTVNSCATLVPIAEFKLPVSDSAKGLFSIFSINPDFFFPVDADTELN